MVKIFKRVHPLVTLSLLFAFALFTASANTISISVDRTSSHQENGTTIYDASLANPFIIRIKTSTDQAIGDIEIDGLDRLSVMGQSQSSNIIMINNKITRQITYTYTVMADQEGEFIIGPARAQVNGNNVESNQVTIHVSHNAPAPGQQANNNEQQTTAFCKLLVDDTRVVVGQPIEATLKIFTRGPIRNLSLGQQPQFAGFATKEIKHAQSKQEVFEGEQYNVTEKKYILFPLSQGEKQLDPLAVIVDVPAEQRQSRRRGFFDEDFFTNILGPQISRRQIKTNPITITVKPVPSYKKNIDAVGSFRDLHATINKNEANLNEPVVLTLSIEGKGNLEQLPAPKLRLPEHFKYYESTTTIQENLDVTYTGGKKTFEFVVQAAKPGLLKIPTQSFTFYDTTSKRFKTLTTQALTLEIKATAGYTPPKQESKPEKPKPIEKEKRPLPDRAPAEDIHFIQEEAARQTPWQLPLWFFILLLFMPMLFYQNIFASYTASLVKKFTGKKSLSRFNDQLSKIIKQKQAVKLHRFFLSFFAEKYGVNISHVTEDWITLALRREDWPEEKINEFIEYLQTCAQLHFASHTKHEDKELLKRGNYWLLNLNK